MIKIWNQIGRPRPPAVDEIKKIDDDNKITKYSDCFVTLSSLSNVIFILINKISYFTNQWYCWSLLYVPHLAYFCWHLPCHHDLSFWLQNMHITYVDPSSLTAYTACCLIPFHKNLGDCLIGSGEVLRRIVHVEIHNL